MHTPASNTRLAFDLTCWHILKWWKLHRATLWSDEAISRVFLKRQQAPEFSPRRPMRAFQLNRSFTLLKNRAKMVSAMLLQQSIGTGTGNKTKLSDDPNEWLLEHLKSLLSTSGHLQHMTAQPHSKLKTQGAGLPLHPLSYFSKNFSFYLCFLCLKESFKKGACI